MQENDFYKPQGLKNWPYIDYNLSKSLEEANIYINNFWTLSLLRILM